jgi:MoxR-like ATPase
VNEDPGTGTGSGSADAPAGAQRPAGVAEIAAECRRVLDAVGRVVVGQERSLGLTLAAVLAGGHVLLEDVPGLGKTLAARSLAAALGLDFRRLQCTPDLLPADVTGSYIYDPSSTSFAFHRGPVFTGLLLVDEINRTPPKTQSALLEAMQERQVTVEGTTFALAPPFHVLATANPVEYEGTFPLPEAQLDRFLLRLEIGYPDRDQEAQVLRRRLVRRREEATVEAVIDPERLMRLQAGVEEVDVNPDVAAYCVDIAASTRRHRAVEVGASPRGSLALLLVARALAVLGGRDVVLPEDVKEVAVAALAHRLTLRPETWSAGTTGADIVREVLDLVPGPTSAPADRAEGRPPSRRAAGSYRPEAAGRPDRVPARDRPGQAGPEEPEGWAWT